MDGASECTHILMLIEDEPPPKGFGVGDFALLLTVLPTVFLRSIRYASAFTLAQDRQFFVS